MKKKKMNKSILFLLLIFIAIISMSFGYCAINNIILDIEGKVNVAGQKTLYIDSIEIDKNTSSENTNLVNYKTEGTWLQIYSLSLPKDNVNLNTNATILVNIKNLTNSLYKFIGTSYMTAEEISKLPAFTIVNSNPNIKIDESSYKNLLNTVINAASRNEIGKMTIPITFKYVDINNITDNTLDISIKINFEEIKNQIYELKTGKNFYNVIETHHNDTKKILFCSESEVPLEATLLGDVSLTNSEVNAYWYNTTIYIAAKSQNATIKFNEDSGYMFSNGKVESAFSKITSIDVSENVFIDTSNVKYFEEMFKGCSSLTNNGIQKFIDLFDTKNAINMCAMFSTLQNVTNLDLNNFNTKNAINMSWMFENNTKLINITFGQNFVTSSVEGTKDNEGLAGMFSGCTRIKTLDLSNFDTANVKTMRFMFWNCTSLEKIYASEKFVTTGIASNIANSNKDVFRNCTSLKGDQGTAFSENNTDSDYAHLDEGVTNPGYFSKLGTLTLTLTLDANGGMFEDGQSINTITDKNKLFVEFKNKPNYSGKFFSGWSENKNANTPTYYIGDTEIFYKDTVLYAVWKEKTIYKLNTGLNVYNIIGKYKETAEHIRFTYKNKVPATSQLLGNIDEDNLGEIEAYYDEQSKTIYISSENEKAIIQFNKDSSHMFSNGKNATDAFSKVKTFDIEESVQIDTSRVEDFSEIFKYNESVSQSSLQEFIKQFDTSSAKKMCAMFEGLRVSTIDISNFNTSNVTDMSWMFHGSDYTNIILGNKFNTNNVTNFDGMFQQLSKIEILDISMINVKTGATVNYMFGLSPKLKKIYVSENNGFEGVKSGERMFENCFSLVGGIGENETTFTNTEISNKYAIISTKDTPGYFTNIKDKEN